MAFEHGHRDEVQVDQLAAIVNMYAQVKERLVVMRASVANERHGPNLFIVKDASDLLQRDNDQDAHVLTDNAVIEMSNFHRLCAVLGFLDGYRRLSKQQVNADVVHGQVEAQDILDVHHVDGRIVLLAEQLHRILFLILLLDELLADRIGRVLFTIIGVNGLELFVIMEEEVANDDIDNLDTDEELVRVLVLIKMVMQRVGCLDAPIEILFLLVDQHPLVLHP
jgi:hypothetical protein